MRRALFFIAALLISVVAQAGPVIVNGGFETGDFTGWTVASTYGNDWWVTSDPFTHWWHSATPGPASGSYYAMTSTFIASSQAILQSFTVDPGTAVQLEFNLFVQSYGYPTVVGDGSLLPVGAGRNFIRVDILTGGASPYDTGAGVVQNLLSGTADPHTPAPWVHYSFDLTSAAGGGGTYQLRFASTETYWTVDMGVDNVMFTGGSGGQVPEPSTLALLGAGLIGLSGLVLGRRRIPSSGAAL